MSAETNPNLRELAHRGLQQQELEVEGLLDRLFSPQTALESRELNRQYGIRAEALVRSGFIFDAKHEIPIGQDPSGDIVVAEGAVIYAAVTRSPYFCWEKGGAMGRRLVMIVQDTGSNEKLKRFTESGAPFLREKRGSIISTDRRLDREVFGENRTLVVVSHRKRNTSCEVKGSNIALTNYLLSLVEDSDQYKQFQAAKTKAPQV
jgi:hypothetical protein